MNFTDYCLEYDTLITQRLPRAKNIIKCFKDFERKKIINCILLVIAELSLNKCHTLPLLARKAFSVAFNLLVILTLDGSRTIISRIFGGSWSKTSYFILL